MQKYDVVIVGGGHAGAQAAIELRNNSYHGSILIISNEKYYPYDRPSLSKDYFLKKKTKAEIFLREESFWAINKIEFLFQKEVVNVDTKKDMLLTLDGSTFSYRHLIWATGGQVRKLKGADQTELNSINYVKNLDDIEEIIQKTETCKHVTIIGGGYIGLETAAALRGLGISVTLLEANSRLLARVTGTQMSKYFYDLHTSNQVDIRLDVKIKEIAINDQSHRIILNDDESITTDMIIVGIGITPNTELLEKAGIVCNNGVVVDDYCRTSQKNIFAIGDCATHHNSFSGHSHLRVESIQNANDMAQTVAEFIAKSPQAYDKKPWFWSEQYSIRLQTVGLLQGFDQEIIRGNLLDNKFSVLYFKNDQLIALDCVNNAKEFVQAKNLVGMSFDNPFDLSDVSRTLKSFIADAKALNKLNVV